MYLCACVCVFVCVFVRVCVHCGVYFVVLSMEQEVDRDEIVIVRRWGHVENKTMDAVLYEGPQEHAKQEDHGETVLMDQDGVI